MRRHQKKYRLPASRRKPGNFRYWLLSLALSVAIVVVFWKSAKSPSSQPPSPKPVAIKPAEPPRPVAPAPTPAPVPVPAPKPVVQAPPVQAVTNTTPPPSTFPRPVRNVFEAQLALVQQGISPGSLDGAIGSQTRAAIAAFQEKAGLSATGQLDETTKSRLLLTNAPLTTCTVTSNDLARLQPLAPTWLGKSQQTALDYETILELVAEKSFSHPALIRQLNPAVDWTNVPAGTVLQVPNAAYPEPRVKAAFVQIHLSAKILEAFDADTNLLAHFPCSIARLVEKRPVGELHVAVVAPNPNYTFDPDVFPESPEAQELKRKLVLPPGPNNPVGVAWIGLDRPGYGIHGTPSPELVGRTESHGCFRLANWNAEYLLRLIAIGTPVYVLE